MTCNVTNIEDMHAWACSGDELPPSPFFSPLYKYTRVTRRTLCTVWQHAAPGENTSPSAARRRRHYRLKVRRSMRGSELTVSQLMVAQWLPGSSGSFILVRQPDHFLTCAFFVLFFFTSFLSLLAACNRFERCFIT